MQSDDERNLGDDCRGEDSSSSDHQKPCCGKGACYGGARPKSRIDRRKSRHQNSAHKINGINIPTPSRRCPTVGFNNNLSEVLLRQKNHLTDSDSSNDDDGCIYTYKGSGSAELQNHFSTNSLNPSQRRLSSPEMDFLEMDFDPGLSNGHESSPSPVSLNALNVRSRSPTDHESSAEETTPEEIDLINLATPPDSKGFLISNNNVDPDQSENQKVCIDDPCYSHKDYEELLLSNTNNPIDTPINVLEEETSVGGCRDACDIADVLKTKICWLLSEKQCMIWSVNEARQKQTLPFGDLSCGTSAVINALEALGYPAEEIMVRESINANPPAHSSSLTEYVFERSKSGAPYSSLLNAISELSDDKVFTKFFFTHHRQNFNVFKWMMSWIEKGAIPIICYNGQMSHDQNTDWVYQMVHGIGPAGVYLASPQKCISRETLCALLAKHPRRVVQRGEIISRWNPDCDLSPLALVKDHDWKALNVLGQIVNVIREEETTAKGDDLTSITIPGIFRSGVILLMSRDNPYHKDMIHSSQTILCVE